MQLRYALILFTLLTDIFKPSLSDSFENNQEYDLRVAYIKAIQNQTDTKQLNHWLNVLVDGNWLQGFEPSDFSKANQNQDTVHLLNTLASRTKKISHSKTALTLNIPDLIPEAIAFDGERLFIGSLKQGAVYLNDNKGIRQFVTLGQPVYAIKYFRDQLWVLSNDRKDANFVSVFNGSTGALVQRYFASEPSEFNDLVFIDGTPYITDSLNSRIVTVSQSSNQLTSFYTSKDKLYPNGITSDGEVIYVATSKGIVKLSIRSKSVLMIDWVEDQSLAGIDGLYWFNHKLVGIQNAMGQSRVILVEDLERSPRIKVLETGHSLFDIPTTGEVTNGKFFYIANSQLLKLESENSINSETYILSIDL